MLSKKAKIWIWIQNNKILKAISNQYSGTLTIYDELDNLIIKRTGLTQQQIKEIEIIFITYGLKRINDKKEPFTYL